MLAFGGSFVKHLGKALAYADDMNTNIIKNSWPDLWDQYLNIGLNMCGGDVDRS